MSGADDPVEVALRWAHVVQWQTGRLHETEDRVYRADLKRQQRLNHSFDDNRKFFELRAEGYFVILAARQLDRALDACGSRRALPPPPVDSRQLVALRNALEHWDGQPRQLPRYTDAAPDHHTWGPDGTRLADLVVIDDLAQWARAVEVHLLEATGQS